MRKQPGHLGAGLCHPQEREVGLEALGGPERRAAHRSQLVAALARAQRTQGPAGQHAVARG